MSIDHHIIYKAKALAGLASIAFVLPAWAIENQGAEGEANDQRHHDDSADLIDPSAVGIADKQAP